MVEERPPAEEAKFRYEIASAVLDAVIHYASLYYRSFLSDGDAAVRRSRAATIATAEDAAKHAAALTTAMRQLWRSGDPAVRQILAPLAEQYPGGDELPLSFGDPGFVATLEEMRRHVELIATTLPADVGGQRPSVLFKELSRRLGGTYSEVTGEPAQTSARAGVPEGRFFHFLKAVVTWLRAAAVEFPDFKFDLPPTDDALRMTLHRLSQANTTRNPN
jgi:hypothetical protein